MTGDTLTQEQFDAIVNAFDSEAISQCIGMPTGMVVLTARDSDIRRGYLIGPDGQKFLLSPKNKVGYQFTYRPQPKQGGWPETL